MLHVGGGGKIDLSKRWPVHSSFLERGGKEIRCDFIYTRGRGKLRRKRATPAFRREGRRKGKPTLNHPFLKEGGKRKNTPGRGKNRRLPFHLLGKKEEKSDFLLSGE